MGAFIFTEKTGKIALRRGGVAGVPFVEAGALRRVADVPWGVVMTRVVVGLSCAGLSIVLLFYAVWLSAGGALGMPSLGAALGLLLIAVVTLRPGRRRRGGGL